MLIVVFIGGSYGFGKACKGNAVYTRHLVLSVPLIGFFVFVFFTGNYFREILQLGPVTSRLLLTVV